MKTNFLIFTICLCAMISCGGPKKQALEIESKEEVVTIASRDSMQESIIVYNSAKARPIVSGNMSVIGKRGVNAKNPPVKLSLWQENLETKELDIANYYTKVSYIKLDYPLPSSQGTFLSNATIETVHGGGKSIAHGVSNWVSLSNELIIVGESYFGYHVFDQSGKFIYTLAQPDKLPTFNKRDSVWKLNTSGKEDCIYGLSVFEDKVLIHTKEENAIKIHLYDLKERKGENTLIYPMQYNAFALVSPTEFVEYNTIYEFKKRNHC